MERRLLADYETLLGEIASALTPASLPTAVALAALPEKMRGFGHVKERNVAAALSEQAVLREALRGGGTPRAMAAE
jgi:indolepyruvate ferredoxin oxidoreductase